MSHLEFLSVTKRFGSVTALDSFSLSLVDGAFVTLLGPSGCGKTTALRIAAGFELLDGGRVLKRGHVISHVPPRDRGMGMVFQGYSLFPHLTVLQNVEFGLRVRRADATKRRTKSLDMLDLVQLSGLEDRYPHQLSGGQQQRVALARALVYEPEVLLLDEPLSALDAKVRVEVRGVIRNLQRSLGTTTLLVTHDQEEALTVSDTVCVMNAGRVEQIASPREVYSSPATDFVAAFVGDSVVLPGARGDVLVRPEDLRLMSVENARLTAGTVFVGRVSGIEFQGATCNVHVKVPGLSREIWVRVFARELNGTVPGNEVGVVMTA